MKEKVTKEGSFVIRIQKCAGARQSVPLHTGWLRGSRERDTNQSGKRGKFFKGNLIFQYISSKSQLTGGRVSFKILRK